MNVCNTSRHAVDDERLANHLHVHRPSSWRHERREIKGIRADGQVRGCHIKIPAGIGNGSRLRSPRNGEAGIRGGPPGDLYIVLHIKEHPVFQRDEDDLYCEVPISFTLAALGGEMPVPTLDGRANVRVPAGTQSGQIFKLRGKGIANIDGRGRGDLLARVIVEVPTQLSADQRKKLEEFSALCDERNTPLHRSFFNRAKEFFR